MKNNPENAIANIKAKIRLQQWAQQMDECQKSGLSIFACCMPMNPYKYLLLSLETGSGIDS